MFKPLVWIYEDEKHKARVNVGTEEISLHVSYLIRPSRKGGLNLIVYDAFGSGKIFGPFENPEDAKNKAEEHYQKSMKEIEALVNALKM